MRSCSDAEESYAYGRQNFDVDGAERHESSAPSSVVLPAMTQPDAPGTIIREYDASESL